MFLTKLQTIVSILDFSYITYVRLCVDGGLMSKDTLPTQSTTLEALLRGEGLDKRNKNDEESLLEIQVSSVRKVRNTPCVNKLLL